MKKKSYYDIISDIKNELYSKIREILENTKGKRCELTDNGVFIIVNGVESLFDEIFMNEVGDILLKDGDKEIGIYNIDYVEDLIFIFDEIS